VTSVKINARDGNANFSHHALGLWLDHI